MKIIQKIIHRLFLRKVPNWYIHFFGALFLSLGLMLGGYFTSEKIQQIFAETESSVSYDTDTHFDNGTVSSTTVSGSGSSAGVQLDGSAGPDGTQYRKAITIDNSGGSELTNYQIEIDEGLVGYWKMDEGTAATATDSAGYSNDGTTNGTTVVSGKYGNARAFNGSSDYIEISSESTDIDVSQKGTIAAWIKLSSIPSSGNLYTILSNADPQSGLYGPFHEIWRNSSGPPQLCLWQDGNINAWTCGTTDFTNLVGEWVYTVSVWDGSTTKIYVNGNLENTVSRSGDSGNGSEWGMGRNPYNNSRYFDGVIDEVRVYNRALSQSEITTLYNSNRSPLLNQVYTNAQEDGSDLRIVDSDESTELNYWIEEFTASGQNAKIWTKVPSIPSGSTKTIYLYYASSSATNESSGDNTFLFFDDFTGSAIDDSKWYSSGSITVENSALRFDIGNIQTKTPLTGNFILEEKSQTVKSNFTNTGHNAIGLMDTDRSDGDGFWGFYRETNSGDGDYWQPYWRSTGSWTSFTDFDERDDNSWYYQKKIRAGTTFEWYIGDEQKFSNTNGNIGSSIYLQAPRVWGNSDDGMKVDWVFARAYTAMEPSISSVGSPETPLATSGTWTSPTDSNVIDLVWNGGWGDGTDGSTAFSATVANVTSNATITFKIRTAATAAGLTGESWSTIGTVNSGTTFTATKADLDALGLSTGSDGRYAQIQAAFAQSDGNNPQLDTFALSYLSDDTAPETNATSIAMQKTQGGNTVSSNGWTNSDEPYFSWSAGADSQAGIKGYCLYLGTDANGDPATSKGLLGTSPASTSGTTCQFIEDGTNIDFSTAAYQGVTWLSSSTDPYYLNVKAVDEAGNVHATSVQFQFRYDDTNPSNPSFISMPSDFISTKEATILWSTTGADAASDSHSDVAGLQYRIGSSGTWYGDSHTGDEDADDLLANDGTYTTQINPDFSDLAQGNNLIYFRTWDNAGNVSTTYVTGVLKVNTTAPSTPQSLTVTPSDSTANSYAFSWNAPTTYTGQVSNITYCYTVNSVPTSTNCSFTSAGQTSLSAGAYATQPGTNTMYIVAKDEAGNINYDTYVSKTFTYSGTAPGIARNMDIADISIKSTSNWKLALSWDAPSDTGAGVSEYNVYRSTSATSCSGGLSGFTNVGSTAGTSYTDTGLSQTDYYYCVKACDSANNCGAVSSTVTAYPDGKFTTAADLTSGPAASSITTQKATITWSTGRDSDSKVAFGTSSGEYNTEEVSNSTQTTSHTINLTNLSAGTTYYYVAKWTDEDGNTGTSDEKSFTTDPAPTVSGVEVQDISISSALVTFTVTGASKAKIYYGPTTTFGGITEITTSTVETTYTVQLTGLDDGTKYFFKVNTFDTEDEEYENQINDFTTLPRPEVSNVRLQELKQAANPTMLVTWNSNTDISSVVTYYPEGNPGAARDEVDVARISGRHRMILRGLQPNQRYVLVVKGVDRAGNEAQSDPQTFTTATDTRPPVISDLNIEGNVNVQQAQDDNQTVQLIVSWNTDEPSTSQVEYGEGTGTTYSQTTQDDKNLTFNHVVIISGLRPSQVYHLRAVSRDAEGNVGKSIDTVTIAPKRTDSAINLVIKNLTETFGFLEALNR